MHLKPKLHQLWRTALWLGKLQLSVFLKIVWDFWLERVVSSLDRLLLWSNRVLRADRKADVNQTCQQSVFSPIGACNRIWCTAAAVERRSQMFVYRPFRFPSSQFPARPKACSQARFMAELCFNSFNYDKFVSRIFDERITPENMHNKVCKMALGVHSKARNHAVKRKLGRFLFILLFTLEFLSTS